jgi:hypothetical protein
MLMLEMLNNLLQQQVTDVVVFWRLTWTCVALVYPPTWMGTENWACRGNRESNKSRK